MHSNGILPTETQDHVLWNKESSKKNHHSSGQKLDITEVFKTHQIFANDDIVLQTDLTYCKDLSDQYQAKIYFKREDLQRGKTYKIRGAYYYYLQNKLNEKLKKEGFVAVSDGNFATSVAIISGTFEFKSIIFVPDSCFPHKIQTMKKQSKGYSEIIQAGMDYEECEILAKKYADEHQLPYVQPHQFTDLMAGYATIAKQILDSKKTSQIDYILVPSGGGALVCSIASFLKQVNPHIKVIAVQPDICTPFSSSILHGKIQTSEKVSKFCNGSSVKRIGQNCYQMGKTCVDGFISVQQNKLASEIIKLYSMGYICEPSAALGVAGLKKIKNQIKGKSVVCILTGSNMDLTKLEQAREMNVIAKGYKNYYIFEVPNKKGAMYEIITKCFNVNDVITVQYSRKINKQTNQALLAVESPTAENVENSVNLLNSLKLKYENINDRGQLLDLFF